MHGPWPTQNFGCVDYSAFGPTNNWPMCSLILRKIRKVSKISATSCQIQRTKFAFRWGSAPHPAGKLIALNRAPQTLAVFKGPILLRG